MWIICLIYVQTWTYSVKTAWTIFTNLLLVFFLRYYSFVAIFHIRFLEVSGSTFIYRWNSIWNWLPTGHGVNETRNLNLEFWRFIPRTGIVSYPLRQIWVISVVCLSTCLSESDTFTSLWKFWQRGLEVKKLSCNQANASPHIELLGAVKGGKNSVAIARN